MDLDFAVRNDCLHRNGRADWTVNSSRNEESAVVWFLLSVSRCGEWAKGWSKEERRVNKTRNKTRKQPTTTRAALQLSPSSSLSSHNTQCKIIVVFVLWPVAESAQKILIFSRLVALFAHAHSNLSSPFALSFLSCACVCTFLDILSVPVTTMPAAVLTNPAS